MNKKKFKLLVLPSVNTIQEVVNQFPFPIELTKGDFKDITIAFQDKKVTVLHKGVDLREFSFIWLCSSWRTRDIAYAIQLYLNQENIPSTRVEKGTSKLTDHMALSLIGVSSPNTLFIGRKNIKTHLAQIKNVCGYPLVIKDIKGSRGISSAKVDSEKDLISELSALPKHKKYIFQQYIPNNYDWGIMVANGVVVSGEKSYPRTSDFRNNAANGAQEVFIDLINIPSHIKEMALKNSNALDLAWSRSDIIIDKKDQTPYVMEVNRFPGVTSATSEVTGAYEFLSSQITPLKKK